MNIRRAQQGFSPLIIILILLVLAGAGFVGWKVFKSDSGSEAADTSESVEATAETDSDGVEMITYQSPAEGIKFDYPSTWTKATRQTTGPDEIDAEYDAISLTSPDGTTVLWDSYLDGIGGACDVATDGELTVSAFEESENIRGVYYVEVKKDGELVEIGLIDKINGEKPKIGGTGNCMLFTIFPGRTSPTSVWLRAGEFDVSNGEDMAALKAILLSARY